MKTLQIFFSGLFIFIIVNFNNYSYCQEWESQNLGSSGVTMDFINANTGFVGLKINGGDNYALYKTVNKGLNFSLLWTDSVTTDNSKGFGIDMINDHIGFMFIESKLLKTTNGGTNWTKLFQIRFNESYEPTIKFYNENLGFITYTAPSLDDNSESFVYKVTNGGNNASSVFTGQAHRIPVIKDIAISSVDPYKIIMVGFYVDHLNQGLTKRFSLVSTDTGSSFTPTYTTYYNTDYSSIAFLPGSSTDYRIIGGYYVGGLSDSVSGTYCFNSTDAGVQSKITNIPENSPGISFINENVDIHMSVILCTKQQIPEQIGFMRMHLILHQTLIRVL